jgi:ABC-type nickel/cobalt efflux system permease component RcnA
MWIAYTTAFSLGIAHALEVDHMVAVSAFIGNRPNFRSAVSFGVLWGMGHSLVVLIVGGALVLSGLSVPQSVTGWAELAVGVMLGRLGVWAARATRRLHVHAPHDHGGHAHLHTHAPKQHPHSHAHGDPARRHRHLSTIVGAIHGLAGTAPVVALIPVTLMPTTWGALGYLAAFGLGTVLAMGTYSALAAVAAARAASSAALARGLAVVTAAASLAVGAWWIVRALGDLTR